MNAGIPTMYRGVRFRSRLEARWAAFFDLIDWDWRYEPYDLNGYIPDFGVLFDAAELLVEVKPAATLDAMRPATAKAEGSGWTGEIMIVGAGLLEPERAHPIVGLLGERTDTPDGRGFEWGPARMFRCINCGEHSVLHEDLSWHCRACGANSGHVGVPDAVPHTWAEAGNRVQWRAA